MPKARERILQFLYSPKLVIVLLFSIILASVLGTFIPQGLPALAYPHTAYSKEPSVFFRVFRLNDVYHSWWFISVLGLLWLSLLACTTRQLKVWPKAYASIVTHIGLLVILLGSLCTSALGEKGFLMVYEGHAQGTFLGSGNTFKNLGFKIYLDDFEIEWYDSSDGKKNNRQIKDFKSKVVIIDDTGKAVLAKIVRVNHPLTFKGYAFYQASYDEKEFKWTGLEVVKDPGVGLVYAGFILLNIGVMLIVYSKSKKNAIFQEAV